MCWYSLGGDMKDRVITLTDEGSDEMLRAVDPRLRYNQDALANGANIDVVRGNDFTQMKAHYPGGPPGASEARLTWPS